ncbi:carboxypeptidase regulatory-like domain-containing protein [uncultured Paludibaculum sp.]|uniref:carboxypeptidase regulatory-like domain-containing protein n=1 Tax=uncultured Paludibaculum sp. TaxID=1765020 RepID=UPI002AAAD119|nr:carboxypeptidase regulatory-like domain-containing protein [uncultured Paludibaculum sp.]
MQHSPAWRVALGAAALAVLGACSRPQSAQKQEKAAPTYFKVDAGTAGTIKGTIRFTGKKPARRVIDMDQEPECAHLHKDGKVMDEEVVVNANGTLANVFVYLKKGLEGKEFEAPSAPVVINQKGCWFEPRVLGMQTGQSLKVTNSDPVTHNIHPMAKVNNEWNHSQGPEDPPLSRKFVREEVMIRVKCNVHSWMRAWVGVVPHPYFAVTGADGSFEIRNVPPGTYTLAAWQERFGSEEQALTLAPSSQQNVTFTFKGE